MDEEQYEELQRRQKETSKTLTETFYEILQLTSLKDAKILSQTPYASLTDCIWILAQAVKELKDYVETLKLK